MHGRDKRERVVDGNGEAKRGEAKNGGTNHRAKTNTGLRARVGQARKLLGTSLALSLIGVAHAQSATDASEALRNDNLRRQEERQREQTRQLQPQVDIRSEEPIVKENPNQVSKLPSTETPCFRIDQIELRGEALERFEWIMPALSAAEQNDSPIGKCIGAQGVGILLKRAQDAVIEKGFVTTRVLAQAQDLSGGTLTLTVLPGRINRILFTTPSSPSTPSTTPTAQGQASTEPVHLDNAMPMGSGDILNLRDIEQALENLKRVPSAEADIKIQPAEAPDQSDLMVSYSQPSILRYNATLDDSGSASTGKYQASATVSIDNPLGLSDLFYATFNHDLNHELGNPDTGERGTQGHTLHYSLPWGYWLLGATTSQNNYHQSVAGLNQDYLYSGTSENSELKLSYLVWRNAVRKTTISLKAWQRKSNNFIDDTEVEVQRRVVGGWELGVNHKEFMGEATLEATLAYKRGTSGFDSIPAPEEAFGEGTSKFGLLSLDASLALPFEAASQHWRYNASLRVQDNTTALTPQDRFAIGGRYSVRGFDGEASLSAERGWTLRNELSLNLAGSNHEAYLGLDCGEVSGPSAVNLIGNTLNGAVIGLRGSLFKVQYELFVGAPLYKPQGFKTADTTSGFSLSVNL